MYHSSSTSKSPSRSPSSGGIARTPKKKCSNISTNTDEYRCQKCLEREGSWFLGDNDDFCTNYVKSLHYINACHAIINELSKAKNRSSSGSASPKASMALLPELPNFMDVYAVVQKNLLSQSSNPGSRNSSKTILNAALSKEKSSDSKIDKPKQRPTNTDSSTSTDKPAKRDQQEMTVLETSPTEEPSLKPKSSFFKLPCEVKPSDDCRKSEINRTSCSPKNSSTETDDSEDSIKRVTNFIEKNKLDIKNRSLRIKDIRMAMSKFKSEMQCYKRKGSDDRMPDKSRSFEGFSNKEADLGETNSNRSKDAKVDGMKDRKGGDSEKDDVFYRYAKELLETSESSMQSTPRKGCIVESKKPSFPTSPRKVKFSDHLIKIPSKSKTNKPAVSKEAPEKNMLNNTHHITSVNCKIATRKIIEESATCGVSNACCDSNSHKDMPKLGEMSKKCSSFNLLDQNKGTAGYLSQSANSLIKPQADSKTGCIVMINNDQSQPPIFQRSRNFEKYSSFVNPKNGRPNERVINVVNYKYEENSDTDYIPSDSESDLTTENEIQRCNEEHLSHPLRLTQNNLNSIDENVVLDMGLFNEKGELSAAIIQILEDEKNCRSCDAKNVPFRVSRAATRDSCGVVKLGDRADHHI